MTQIRWYKLLRQLNPRLRVCQFDSSKHLPGVYYVDDREGIVDICATDIGYVPALPEFDSQGILKKSGYRRVVLALLALNLTTREKVRKVFPGFFECRYPKPNLTQTRSLHQQWSEMMKDERRFANLLGDARRIDVSDLVMDKMRQMELDNNARHGNSALKGDQFVELADEVEKKMSDDQLRDLDEAKFRYDKAVGKGRIIDAG